MEQERDQRPAAEEAEDLKKLDDQAENVRQTLRARAEREADEDEEETDG